MSSYLSPEDVAKRQSAFADFLKTGNMHNPDLIAGEKFISMPKEAEGKNEND